MLTSAGPTWKAPTVMEVLRMLPFLRHTRRGVIQARTWSPAQSCNRLCCKRSSLNWQPSSWGLAKLYRSPSSHVRPLNWLLPAALQAT